MKKWLTAIVFILGMIVGSVILSSFTERKQECVQNGMNVPTYWEGEACTSWNYGHYCINIKVYQTEGMCNSFYAVITSGDDAGYELWVKENPHYDPYRQTDYLGKYFVTYKDRNYYFDM